MQVELTSVSAAGKLEDNSTMDILLHFRFSQFCTFTFRIHRNVERFFSVKKHLEPILNSYFLKDLLWILDVAAVPCDG